MYKELGTQEPSGSTEPGGCSIHIGRTMGNPPGFRAAETGRWGYSGNWQQDPISEQHSEASECGGGFGKAAKSGHWVGAGVASSAKDCRLLGAPFKSPHVHPW